MSVVRACSSISPLTSLLKLLKCAARAKQADNEIQMKKGKLITDDGLSKLVLINLIGNKKKSLCWNYP